MNTIEQLTFLCLQWRILLKTKEEIYRLISDPEKRVEAAMHIINIRIELYLMEEELCGYLKIPSHVVASAA